MFIKILFQIKREPDENEEEKVVTTDVENLKWKSVKQKMLDKMNLSNIRSTINLSTRLTELTPHARCAVFVREVVSKGEAKTSKIHYIQVSPGSMISFILFHLNMLFFSVFKTLGVTRSMHPSIAISWVAIIIFKRTCTHFFS